VVCIGLGWLGSQEVSDNTTLAARLLAFCYFAFFLIVLPLLGLVEKTKPLPASIADAVLVKGGPAALPAE
jgi:ubiquinol-cytochrome c reductase cytochrome b/c1 subunit